MTAAVYTLLQPNILQALILMKKGSDNHLLGSAGYTVLYADCMQLFRQADSDDYSLLWNEQLCLRKVFKQIR